jgi:hypothetical protein
MEVGVSLSGAWARLASVVALVGLVFAGTARAQSGTAALYGKVTDQSGAALPGVTVTITLGAFDPRLRLSEQILALNTRTGDAFAMEPPAPPRWGRPFEGKLYPNGIYRGCDQHVNWAGRSR